MPQGENEEPPMDDPNAIEQPPMDDPNAMEQPPMDDPMMGDQGGMEQPPMDGEDDSTMSIINQLSDIDKEAVRAYAESMLNRDESSADENMPGGEQPMMESVIFTKKQMDAILENVGIANDEEEKDNVNGFSKKKGKTVSNKSPFNTPKFK